MVMKNFVNSQPASNLDNNKQKKLIIHFSIVKPIHYCLNKVCII